MCAEILGKTDEKVIALPSLLIEGGAQLSKFISDHITHSKPILNPKELEYMSRYAFMDSSKARKELGYNPRDVIISLHDAINWFNSDAFKRDQISNMPMRSSVNYQT